MSISGTKALEAWCKRVTSGYDNVNILNMTTSWRSGLAFCAIIHHHCPELIEYDVLDPDDVYGNNSLAFNVAEQHLGIPSLLDPQDMVECELLDRLSILTYLAQFFQAFNSSNNPIKANIISKGSLSSSSTGSDLTDAAKLQMKNPMVGRQSEPCRQCGKSVFILERLNVGGKIFHRTCFKCARCEEQLTLASFYETEAGQFCCEVCPDEETKERERTLRVNKDLAKLMAGDSGESDVELSDTDGSVISEAISTKDNASTKSVVNGDTDDVTGSVEIDMVEEKLSNLSCVNASIDGSVNSTTIECSELEIPPSNLPLNDNVMDDMKIEQCNISIQEDDNVGNRIVSLKSDETSTVLDVTDDTAVNDYPLDMNPFGDDEADGNDANESVSEESHLIAKSESLNPFGSDLESDEETPDSSSCNIPESKPTSNQSLNPFGSDLDSEDEKPTVSASPTPSIRSTLHSRKKRPAPPPPSQGTPIPAPRHSLKASTIASPPSPIQRKSRVTHSAPAETAKRMKDVDNIQRRSQIMEGMKKSESISSQAQQDQISHPKVVSSSKGHEDEPNKSEEGQWRKKKGPAPPRPLPPKRTVKKLPRKAINQELFDIEVKQGGLERQGVKLEKTIREICAASDAEEGADRDSLGPEAEDLIIQLFDLVNEKNELFRRQTELIYMKKENRLEEMHADCEYQIRVLMAKPECQRTDDDKVSEERLITKLVEIVTQRNEIVDCLEMDRLRELDEDTAIEDHMSDYAAVKPAEFPKKGLIKMLKRKKKKKHKDDEKDVDTSETKEDHLGEEKVKKKSARKKLINLASKKLSFPQKK